MIRLPHVSEFVFGTHNAAFVQVMYESYLRDPDSVDAEWRALFDNGRLAELPVIPTDRAEIVATAPAPQPPAPPPTTTPSSPLPQNLTPIAGPAARLVERRVRRARRECRQRFLHGHALGRAPPARRIPRVVLARDRRVDPPQRVHRLDGRVGTEGEVRPALQ